MFDGLWYFRYKLLKQRLNRYEKETRYYKEKCEQLYSDYCICENDKDLLKDQLNKAIRKNK